MGSPRDPWFHDLKRDSEKKIGCSAGIVRRARRVGGEGVTYQDDSALICAESSGVFVEWAWLKVFIKPVCFFMLKEFTNVGSPFANAPANATCTSLGVFVWCSFPQREHSTREGFFFPFQSKHEESLNVAAILDVTDSTPISNTTKFPSSYQSHRGVSHSRKLGKRPERIDPAAHCSPWGGVFVRQSSDVALRQRLHRLVSLEDLQDNGRRVGVRESEIAQQKKGSGQDYFSRRQPKPTQV